MGKRDLRRARPYYVGFVQHDRTMSRRETYAYCAERTGFKTAAIRAVFMALAVATLFELSRITPFPQRQTASRFSTRRECSRGTRPGANRCSRSAPKARLPNCMSQGRRRRCPCAGKAHAVRRQYHHKPHSLGMRILQHRLSVERVPQGDRAIPPRLEQELRAHTHQMINCVAAVSGGWCSPIAASRPGCIDGALEPYLEIHAVGFCGGCRQARTAYQCRDHLP